MLQSKSLPPLTVSQLTNAIKMSLESSFPSICLQGEISNMKVQASGHLYFSLKDAEAQILAVMFKADAAFLKAPPKAGDQVVVKGELNVYPPKGNYQLIVRELSFVGLGELLLKLEALKIKLHQMGWFKASRKKPLPSFPKRIGVVTSPTGAVIQDIINVLSRRFSGFHLILNPVKVQGEGSAEEIAQAIDQFNRFSLADVLIIGRGGGSLEDLWAFNEEIVAAAIYRSRIPIISAVGHETDHCIADYVADVRAPTPSAAAELVIAEKRHQLEYLGTLKKRMQQSIRHHILQYRYRLKGHLLHPIISNPYGLLEWRMQKIDDFREELDNAANRLLSLKKNQLEAKFLQSLALKPSNLIIHFKRRLYEIERTYQLHFNQELSQKRQMLSHKIERLDHLWHTQQARRIQLFDAQRQRQRLDQLLNDRIILFGRKLSHMEALLKALDPKNILEKGYSILFAEKGAFVINSIKNINQGQKARLLLSDGEAVIEIHEVIPLESKRHTRSPPPSFKF